MKNLGKRFLIVFISVLLVGCNRGDPYVRLEESSEAPNFSVAWPTLENDEGRKLILVNTVHLGEAEFFHSVQSSLDQEPVVFMEGLKGKDTNLKELGRLYRKMARLLGVKTQRDVLTRREHWLKPDVHVDKIARTMRRLVEGLQIGVYGLKGHLAESQRLAQSSAPWLNKEESHAYAQAMVRREIGASLAEDTNSDQVVIVYRNKKLLKELRSWLETDGNQTRRIAICYGVGHCFDLVNRLEQEGWRVVSTEWQRVFSVSPRGRPQRPREVTP